MTELGPSGQARMVDVSRKPPTVRRAVARGRLLASPEAIGRLVRGELAKGDALGVARVAGILGAKRTSDLIPLCHPLPLTGVDVRFEVGEREVAIEAEVRCVGPTGVEMEALTAVSLAALALYDMLKGVDRTLKISDIRLVRKEGGRSGAWEAPEEGEGSG